MSMVSVLKKMENLSCHKIYIVENESNLSNYGQTDFIKQDDGITQIYNFPKTPPQLTSPVYRPVKAINAQLVQHKILNSTAHNNVSSSLKHCPVSAENTSITEAAHLINKQRENCKYKRKYHITKTQIENHFVGSKNASDSCNTIETKTKSKVDASVAGSSNSKPLIKQHNNIFTKIPPSKFKEQLLDTSDVTHPIIYMPHTKSFMNISDWDFEKSLTMPQRHVSSKHRILYERNCISTPEPDEFDVSELNLLPLGYKPQIDLSTIKRIVRKRKNPCLQNIATTETEMVAEEYKNTDSLEYVELVGTEGDQQNYIYVDGDFSETDEIIIIHRGANISDAIQNINLETNTSKSNNMDVLFAAAAKNSPNLVMLCQQPTSYQQNNITDNMHSVDSYRLPVTAWTSSSN